MIDARSVVIFSYDFGGHPSSRPQCCLTKPGSALRRHKMGVDTYREVLHAQGGVCPLCSGYSTVNFVAVPLSIDHDHLCCSTERRLCGRCWRGLLCSNCNSALGLRELYGWPDPHWTDSYDAAWDERARRYLLAAGCDPDSPCRRDLGRREVERRRALRRAAAGG